MLVLKDGSMTGVNGVQDALAKLGVRTTGSMNMSENISDNISTGNGPDCVDNILVIAILCLTGYLIYRKCNRK